MFRNNLPILVALVCIVAGEYQIELSNDGPIVKGSTISFKAVIIENGKVTSNERFEYSWEDNGIPNHSYENKDGGSTDVWTVRYDAGVYPAGTYNVQVAVKRCVLFSVYCYPIGSSRDYFQITETLNGMIKLKQDNQTRTINVSNNSTVIHMVDIKKSDMDFIKNAPSIVTYWFVNCTYYNYTSELNFPFNYTKAEENYLVEALVVADFNPPPPPTTTVAPTTTTKPTSTTKPTPTTKTTTTTKPPPPTTATPKTTVPPSTTPLPNVTVPTPHALVKRGVEAVKNKTSQITVNINGTLVPYNGTFPFVCNGDVAVGYNKTYGFYQKRLTVKAPISNINITGNTWLQPSDILNLKVMCSGSQNIEFCVFFVRGSYNVTGNETCSVYMRLKKCEVPIKRYFRDPQNTVIIILRNDISHVVKSVFVNIYKVNKQTQLSVIVVPVAFSLVAVVMIVFGVAYYIQHRSRFIVEVADFNFRQEFGDIEYKTFGERLRDSIANAFTRAPSPSTSEVPVWPPGGQKYGSMT